MSVPLQVKRKAARRPICRTPREGHRKGARRATRVEFVKSRLYTCKNGITTQQLGGLPGFGQGNHFRPANGSRLARGIPFDHFEPTPSHPL